MAEILQEMLKMIRRSQQISEQEIRYFIHTRRKQQAVDLGDLKSKVLARTHSGKMITPKTEGQRSFFIEAMEKKTIVFAVGPAGTGKVSTVACGLRCQYTEERRDSPNHSDSACSVETGESLGVFARRSEGKLIRIYARCMTRCMI